MKKGHYQDIPQIDFYDFEDGLYCLMLNDGSHMFFIYQSNYPTFNLGLTCGDILREEANEYYDTNCGSLLFSLKLNASFYSKTHHSVAEYPLEGNKKFVVDNFIVFLKKNNMNVKQCISIIKERIKPKHIEVVRNEEIYHL